MSRPGNPPRRRACAAALAFAFAAGLALAGCSSEGARLTADAAYVPEPVTADMAAGYFTVRNSGGSDDRLTSVTSDVSGDVTMHKTVGTTMREVRSFTIPAGGELELRRGGNHLMLMDLDHRPRKGEKVTLELHFAASDPIKLDVPVESATYSPRK
ncbi:copper chaperone PCu(A)C [Streptomyces pathocidini]|uniref:Copper chaperone PCu(A)C n=1 Tax=Streptomyces pathocidini TaxID=1650571 RepID=A0ABW7US26_9ACTN|nr:copper chaperone PCu(A)C [Streptomyces pathocidini]